MLCIHDGLSWKKRIIHNYEIYKFLHDIFNFVITYGIGFPCPSRLPLWLAGSPVKQNEAPVGRLIFSFTAKAVKRYE